MALTEQERLTIMTMLRAMHETMKDIKGQIQRIRIRMDTGSISTGKQLEIKEQACSFEEIIQSNDLIKELKNEIVDTKKEDKELIRGYTGFIFEGTQLEIKEQKACFFEERGFSFLTKELEDEIANIKKVDDYKELFQGYIGFIFKGVQLEINEKACPFEERGFSLPEIRMRMDGGIVKRGMG